MIREYVFPTGVRMNRRWKGVGMNREGRMGREGRKRSLLRKAKARPQSLGFDELLELAAHYGFRYDRTRGSHRQYVREDDPYGMMTFQPDPKDKKMAKRYQVVQLVGFIVKNGLEDEEEEEEQ